MCRCGLAQGFTLIELMVVLVIVGIVTAVALPSLGRPDPQVRLERDAAAFAGLIGTARHYAVLARRPTGVRITPAGVYALRWDGTGWRALPGRSVAPVRFVDQRRIEWLLPSRGSGKTVEKAPQIVLLPAGTMMPFELRLSAADGPTAQAVRVAGEPTGRVRLGDAGS